MRRFIAVAYVISDGRANTGDSVRRVARDSNPGSPAGNRTSFQRQPSAHPIAASASGRSRLRVGQRAGPTALAKQLRQARGKVERKEPLKGDSLLLNARLELHVPPAGFARHEVQRLLVMFAGVTRPRSVPYALRLVFDEA